MKVLKPITTLLAATASAASALPHSNKPGSDLISRDPDGTNPGGYSACMTGQLPTSVFNVHGSNVSSSAWGTTSVRVVPRSNATNPNTTSPIDNPSLFTTKVIENLKGVCSTNDSVWSFGCGLPGTPDCSNVYACQQGVPESTVVGQVNVLCDGGSKFIVGTDWFDLTNPLKTCVYNNAVLAVANASNCTVQPGSTNFGIPFNVSLGPTNATKSNDTSHSGAAPAVASSVLGPVMSAALGLYLIM